jgi:threonine dehydrogenase-like Zn-dependent dehydrogenase
MGINLTVFKGSKTGAIIEANGHRDPGPTEAVIKISRCGVCGTDEHYRHQDQGKAWAMKVPASLLRLDLW